MFLSSSMVVGLGTFASLAGTVLIIAICVALADRAGRRTTRSDRR